MSYTYEELKHQTVAELRSIAKETEHEALKGHTQLNKEHLLTALCTALNIDMHVHHHVEGVDKKSIKEHIREMKRKRDEALKQHDLAQVKFTRIQIRQLKRQLRKATV